MHRLTRKVHNCTLRHEPLLACLAAQHGLQAIIRAVLQASARTQQDSLDFARICHGNTSERKAKKS